MGISSLSPYRVTRPKTLRSSLHSLGVSLAEGRRPRRPVRTSEAVAVTHKVGTAVEAQSGCITLYWVNRCSVSLSKSGKSFRQAKLRKVPGVYRIRVHKGGEQLHCYIGHGVNVRRRVAQDVRYHRKAIRKALRAGGNVQVD